MAIWAFFYSVFRKFTHPAAAVPCFTSHVNDLSGSLLCLASEAYLSRLNSMKPTFIALLALCLCLGGCGKEEPVQPSASNTEATKPEPTKAKAVAGVKLWEFKTGDAVNSSPAIGSDGTVYVGSADKKLYAIKTDSKGPAKSPWPMRGQNPLHTGRAVKK